MIETFIKPVIYNKNRPGSTEQIAAGTYKNFDYYVLNLRTHPTAYVDVSDSLLNGICYDEIDIYIVMAGLHIQNLLLTLLTKRVGLSARIMLIMGTT